MTNREFIFTNHLRQRFVQRTTNEYKHLKECREKECETCKELEQDIRLKVAENEREINSQIRKRISRADENRSYLNNTGFMSWYYEKYGYDTQFQFLVHKDILFVVLIKRGRKVVVTCLEAKTHLVGKATAARKKYNKIPTKEKKEEARLLKQIEEEARSA